MVARVRDAYGGVDILVNNAGILGGQSVPEMPVERWNRQIAVNLTGTFLCTKHVAGPMVEQRPRGTIADSTSKSGLLNFTRAAAMDLARHGIRVNSLTPSATDTEEAADRAVAWGRPWPEPRARGLDFPKMVPMGKLPRWSSWPPTTRR